MDRPLFINRGAALSARDCAGPQKRQHRKHCSKGRPTAEAGRFSGVAQVEPILARAQGPFAIKTVSVVEQSGGPVTKTFTLQAGSGSRWALAELVFRGAAGSSQLEGFHAWAANSDPSKLNDFSIDERGLVGFLWLFAMCTSVVLCVVAVVLIWRRPWLSRRWLWTLGSVLGLGSFGLNWSTGAWAVRFVYVMLLGAGATKAGPFAPWVLTFGFPVVAIVVIVRWLRAFPREPSEV